MEEFYKAMPIICRHLQESEYQIFDRSLTGVGGCKIIFARFGNKEMFLAIGENAFYDELIGERFLDFKICSQSHTNRLVLNKYLDHTNPRAFGRNVATIGLGDRLGIATPAHIAAVRDKNVKPVLAQQSKRELGLTGRTYEDVLDDVCYAVLREGYTDGFGADGDHLKYEEDISEALAIGYSMITLDGSEKINTKAEQCTDAELRRLYRELPEHIRKQYEADYLNKSQSIQDIQIEYDLTALMQNVLIYHDVICYVQHIYEKYIRVNHKAVDFEVSLDETAAQTSILGHYFVANELNKKDISICSLAPRFVGEFQKGIDYIGDLAGFEKDLGEHAKLADYFGYKLSVHSGSDKFSIFKFIGMYTNNRFHIKTSGTSWLEAIRVIIRKNPELYRKMHKYALRYFEDAKANYHVSANAASIARVENLSDEELLSLMEDKNARQLMHITYGYFLKLDEDGKNPFRDDIYETLLENSDTYDQYLFAHINRHLECLGIH